MKVIGMTGGIGSGKTTASGIFQELGVPVYSADERAKKLMVENETLKGNIIREFGEAAYAGGDLNRPFLSDRVFGSHERLSVLNALVHPAVADDFEKWLRSHSKVPYVLKEAAILFESGAHGAVDSSVLVVAPEYLRIQRVVGRDGVSEEDVRRRMASQWSEERKKALADYIINNDGTQLLIPQVLGLHNMFSRQ